MSLTKWLPCCHALLAIKMTTKKTHRYFRQMIKIKNFTNEDYYKSLLQVFKQVSPPPVHFVSVESL